MAKKKKMNTVTGCPKIDIYVNGIYRCSTQQSSTCKQAVEKFRTSMGSTLSDKAKVKAFFDYQ